MTPGPVEPWSFRVARLGRSRCHHHRPCPSEWGTQCHCPHPSECRTECHCPGCRPRNWLRVIAETQEGQTCIQPLLLSSAWAIAQEPPSGREGGQLGAEGEAVPWLIHPQGPLAPGGWSCSQMRVRLRAARVTCCVGTHPLVRCESGK